MKAAIIPNQGFLREYQTVRYQRLPEFFNLPLPDGESAGVMLVEVPGSWQESFLHLGFGVTMRI